MARNFRAMAGTLRRVREQSSIAVDEAPRMRLKSLRILGILACLGLLAVQGNWVGLLCCLLIIALMRLTVPTGRELLPPPTPLSAAQKAMTILDVVPGMTAASKRDFSKSLSIMTLQDGTIVKTYKNPVGVDHIFLADSEENMIYAGFVGWIHYKGLQSAIAQIRRELT
jgi:hypothetical protein